MIPYDIDPSLYTAEPEAPMLDDGFSPPHRARPGATAEALSAPVDATAEPQAPANTAV